MRVDQLLAHYLYQYKKLELPGIGSFSLDATAPIVESQEQDKHGKGYIPGISYSKKSNSNIEDSLVDFICEYTGKQKFLAISDIDSYITLSKEFLNIGNPLVIAGIGTLVKKKDGSLEFIPGGSVASTPLQHPHALREVASHDLFETTQRREKQEQEQLYQRRNNNSNIILVLSIIVLLALISWAVYYYWFARSSKNMPRTEEVATPIEKKEDTTTSSHTTKAYARDTTLVSKGNNVDTSSINTNRSRTVVANTPATGTTRFVLETTVNKERALKRYNQLIEYGHNDLKLLVNADSTSFKLYYDLKTIPGDTARIKDSLSRYFNRRIVIE